MRAAVRQYVLGVRTCGFPNFDFGTSNEGLLCFNFLDIIISGGSDLKIMVGPASATSRKFLWAW